MPSIHDILSIRTDQIAKFIQEHASAKTLTPMMKHLNQQLTAGDAVDSREAARALEHLGFPEYA